MLEEPPGIVACTCHSLANVTRVPAKAWLVQAPGASALMVSPSGSSCLRSSHQHVQPIAVGSLRGQERAGGIEGQGLVAARSLALDTHAPGWGRRPSTHQCVISGVMSTLSGPQFLPQARAEVRRKSREALWVWPFLHQHHGSPRSSRTR